MVYFVTLWYCMVLHCIVWYVIQFHCTVLHANALLASARGLCLARRLYTSYYVMMYLLRIESSPTMKGELPEDSFESEFQWWKVYFGDRRVGFAKKANIKRVCGWLPAAAVDRDTWQHLKPKHLNPLLFRFFLIFPFLSLVFNTKSCPTIWRVIMLD